MGYAKIKNLYADQTVLMLKELYALEKVHGTSAHVKWNKGVLSFFAGGMGHDTFVELFDQPDLIYRLGQGLERGTVTVYGEAYGGKIQGMSGTYGVKAKFIGFDVSIDNVWLTVPSAAEVCAMLGIDFVSYERIPATLEAINAERDRPSAVATLNGVANPAKGREGVVLRPLIVLFDAHGNRVCAKHKSDAFRETKTPRVVSEDKQKILDDSREIAQEYVTHMRLTHVLDKLGNPSDIESTGAVTKAMVEDVIAEAGDEIVVSREVRKAVSIEAAKMYRTTLSMEIPE